MDVIKIANALGYDNRKSFTDFDVIALLIDLNKSNESFISFIPPELITEICKYLFGKHEDGHIFATSHSLDAYIEQDKLYMLVMDNDEIFIISKKEGFLYEVKYSQSNVYCDLLYINPTIQNFFIQFTIKYSVSLMIHHDGYQSFLLRQSYYATIRVIPLYPYYSNDDWINISDRARKQCFRRENVAEGNQIIVNFIKRKIN